MRFRFTFWFMSFLVAAIPGPVWAHALGADCRLRGGRVEVEAFFDDDTPARNAQVSVVDADKETVAQGKTDGAGRWSFPLPAPGQYKVIVDAGAGHRTTRLVMVPQPEASSPIPNKSAETNLSKVDIPEGTSEAPLISTGPSRQQFTRFPWLKVALGLGTITALCLAFLLAKWLQRSDGQ
jgi:hypothetical protein